MAYKSIFLFALNLVYLVHSEQNHLCPCDAKDRESEVLLWEFLKKLSDDVPESGNKMYAVLPGQLSPLVDCNCEFNRKKRNLIEAPPEVKEPKVRSKKSLRQQGDCPLGHTLFYSLCVSNDHFDDYYDDSEYSESEYYNN